MKSGFVLGTCTALALVAGFSVLAAAPPAPAPEQAPTVQVIEAAKDDVAALRLRTVALSAKDRREAEKLLSDASTRLKSTQERLPAANNPRLAKYLQNETRMAKTRIEEAREIVEQGGPH